MAGNDLQVEPPRTMAPRESPPKKMTPPKRKRGAEHHARIKPMNKRMKKAEVKEGSNEEILLKDVENLSLATQASNPPGTGEEESLPPPARFCEIDIQITELSSSGDGLGYPTYGSRNRIYSVPFSLPGDTVRARIVRHYDNPHPYTLTDYISTVIPSTTYPRIEPRCKHFAVCAGCSFQMLPYDTQLRIKRDVVKKAYESFSGLAAEKVPEIMETQGSPLVYGYRTKLTPHFDVPRKEMKEGKERLPVGYNMKGRRTIVDIEQCPIGTELVEKGVLEEIGRAREKVGIYAKGATLMIRESTTRVEAGDEATKLGSEPNGNAISRSLTPPPPRAGTSQPKTIESKRYITDSSLTATEYINNFRFDFLAGSFFQNNASILPSLIEHILTHLRSILSPAQTGEEKPAPPMSLIDAYCGAGLFSLLLSPFPFRHILGLDVSHQSIESAKLNKAHNSVKLPRDSSLEFKEADASTIFAEARLIVPEPPTAENQNGGTAFDPEHTVVVVDPPRKGCSEDFLEQLVEFGPRVVVYVSCNVHTQARDVGWLLKRGGEKGGEGGRYRIESLRGFDFFPQTSQVEGVAILVRV